MKKRSISDIIFFSIYLIISCYALVTFLANQDLKEQLSYQNDLLSDIQKRDSLLNVETKIQTEVITRTVEKYIDRTFVQGTKQLSIDDLLDYANKLEREGLLKRDSIKFYRKQAIILDSVSSEYQIAKSKLSLLSKRYDVEFVTSFQIDSLNDKSYTVKIISPKIDSALRLLPYYRNKLKYVPEEKSWYITTEKSKN